MMKNNYRIYVLCLLSFLLACVPITKQLEKKTLVFKSPGNVIAEYIFMPDKTYCYHSYYEGQNQPNVFVFGKYEVVNKNKIALKEVTYAPIHADFKEEFDPNLPKDSITIVVSLINNENSDYFIDRAKTIFFVINDTSFQKSFPAGKIKKVANIKTIKLLTYSCPTLETATFNIQQQISNKYIFSLRNNNILSSYGGIGVIDTNQMLNFGGDWIANPRKQYVDTLTILNNEKIKELSEIYKLVK